MQKELPIAVKSWFDVQAKAGGVEIDIFDEIGLWGITAKDFREDLEEADNGGPIKVNINSPGGSVFDGIAIYALLSERRDRVSVHVYGLAASIASVIALAGSDLTMHDGAFFMIHDPWSITLGDAEDHRHTADILDKIGGQIMDIYRQHTFMTDDELRDAMEAETWYTAQETVSVGFASGVEGEKVAALTRFQMLDRFKNAPVATEPEEEEEPDVEPEENTQAESLPNGRETVEDVSKNDAQAGGQPAVKDAVTREDLDGLRSEFSAKLDSISVRPKISPKITDEGAQWFYDTLRYASENRGHGFKAAADTITTADGMGIPVAASEKILMNVNQMSILRKYGADVRPAGAQSTRFSTVVDTGTAGLITEGGDYDEKADPTLITLSLYKLGGRFSITEESVEDTFMDMYDVFSRYAARLIARAENAYFISGSGSSQPKGIDEETASVTAAAHNAVTFAELVELDESLSAEWRWSLGSVEQGNYQGPIYLVAASTAESLRVLQDSNSNYFFRNHEENGMQTLFGKPLIRDANVAAMGTVDNPAILLVHPAAYLIGERRPQLALKVGYDNDSHNVTWDFNERVGGQVWDTNGVAILQMAATT